MHKCEVRLTVTESWGPQWQYGASQEIRLDGEPPSRESLRLLAQRLAEGVSSKIAARKTAGTPKPDGKGGV